jgi:peptide/nickel transport system ATP-binding protein
MVYETPRIRMADRLLLEVKDLRTHFFTDEGIVKAVDGVDFEIERGKIVCVVGESGCGKSVTARSILQIVDPPGRVVAGQVLLHRNGSTLDLASLDPRGKAIRAIRGKDIGMIFQEPMTSLSPVHTIGDQIMESIRLHLPDSAREARKRTIELLSKVGIPRPEQRLDAYPFQLSGGMRQRAMIAMGLACGPGLLIADEPTTALDVTTQAQILDLITELQIELGMAVLLITHDLGVVAEMADSVVVMYLGTVAERGSVDAIFHDPKHPYTQALLRSIPKVGVGVRERLATIHGSVPPPFARPTGCAFHPRCERMMPGRCDRMVPPRIRTDTSDVRCLLYQGPASK